MAGQVAPTASPDLSLFKTHKALPKRRAFSSEMGAITIATSKAPKYDLGREGYSSTDRIHSWIPAPSRVHPSSDHGLPLTPPLHASEKTNRLSRTESPPNGASAPYASAHSASTGFTTPVLKGSPPTPETTPPKLHQRTHVLAESSISRLPSIRAESFETARENLTTDEESSQPESPSLRPSRQQWLRSVGHARPKSIGLGLGLESVEDGEQTPTNIAPTTISPQDEELVYFDGAWNDATPEMDAVRDGADLAYRAELMKRLLKRPRISDQLLETPFVMQKGGPSLITRSPSLRERVDQNRQTPPRPSTEDFAEKIQWPRQDDRFGAEEKLREMDNRRFSQISTTSTTVEAVILSTSPKRRRTLRHSSKYTDLNSASEQSERRISTTVDHGHRRLSKHARSPEDGQRASLASGTYGEGHVISSRKKLDVIPSSRPTTAPEDSIGYFDVPQSERRIMSAYVPKSPPKQARSQSKQPPAAHAVNMPFPTANGAKNISRANSNGSTGNDSISPPTRQQSQIGYRFPDTLNAGVTSPDEGSNGDWSALRPRSSLVTPFSLRSARSSTPGTLEVNEATAISIYPHTNKSILVVQHAPRSNSQPAEHSAIIASNAKFAIPAGSAQPPVIHEPHQLLNSPLQNPRSPPQPPDFKITPPTPANMTDISSPDRHREESNQQLPKRRLSNRVKRAFSTRRYSDAFVSPIARSFSLSHRNTVTGVRRASTGIDLERNLHPSWRPRAFWDKDDQSDSDSDFGNDGFLVGNSLSMPSEGVKTFNPPSRGGSLSRRLGSLRLPRRRGRTGSAPDAAIAIAQHDGLYDDILPDRTPAQRSNSMRGLGLSHKTAKFYRRGGGGGGANDSYEFIQPPHARENGGAAGGNGVPRLGYQVQFVGFKGLAEKVKQRREEARREKVRERLRGSIDVLRGT
ncbi:MAG: hypothetical protein LQ341_000973 [Variospora aurantia]|nr:MAG: hypothetical protein LQ341_000973 [Variospora aurantia]